MRPHEQAYGRRSTLGILYLPAKGEYEGEGEGESEGEGGEGPTKT